MHGNVMDSFVGCKYYSKKKKPVAPANQSAQDNTQDAVENKHCLFGRGCSSTVASSATGDDSSPPQYLLRSTFSSPLLPMFSTSLSS